MREIFSGVGLATAEIAKLSDNSLGCFSIQSFCKVRPWERLKNKRFVDGRWGNALGIQGTHRTYQYYTATEVLRLRTYENFVSEFNLYLVEESPPYLVNEFAHVLIEKLSRMPIPAVFFLPEKARNHPKANITKYELNAALENMRFIKNSFFVSGLYSLIPREANGLKHKLEKMLD